MVLTLIILEIASPVAAQLPIPEGPDEVPPSTDIVRTLGLV